MMRCKHLVLFCCLFGLSVFVNAQEKAFPQHFKIGSATSSYQIEGAALEGGKGESIWDKFVRKNPSPIKDGANGDISTDSYHRYKEDIQLMKDIGFDFYRFSISWPRIQPRGEMNEINKEGIKYYNNLINELIANKIEPVVTMYHWDLPQSLQELGGWTNPLIADYFEDYAYVLYSHFGDRVKTWITINEPTIIIFGYNGKMMAPGLSLNGSAEYLVGHNIIRAHAKAYRLYDEYFKRKQKGQVGITLVGEYFIPFNASEANIRAAERAFQFNIGWFANPIFSKEGDYPRVMRETVNKNSVLEGRRRSRLPYFTPEEIKQIRGSSDFFGLNHYSSNIASEMTKIIGTESYYTRDMMVNLKPDPTWIASPEVPWFYVFPAGLRGMLKYIKNNYNNPSVFITENGYGDSGRTDDYERIDFYQGYLSEMLKAIYIDKCNVIGYTVWSLMDNFEWAIGYTAKFGIIHVDFESLEPKRTPKLSYYYFKRLVMFRELPTISNQSLQRHNNHNHGLIFVEN